MTSTAEQDPLEFNAREKVIIKQEIKEERINQEEEASKRKLEEYESIEDEKNSNQQYKIEEEESVTDTGEDVIEAEEGRRKEVSEEITVDVEVIELSDDDGDYVEKPRRGRPAKLPKEAQCEICSKIFGDKHILKKHTLTHTDEKPHVCECCGKAFRHKHSLKAHKFTHEGPDAGRFFRCAECGASFKRNCTLVTHRRIHSGERPHACHLCLKTFVQKVNLQQHIKTHLNERNHACDKCEKKFVTASKLKRHYQRHVKKQLKDTLQHQGPLKNPRMRKKNNPKKVDNVGNDSEEEWLESDDGSELSGHSNGWVAIDRAKGDSVLS